MDEPIEDRATGISIRFVREWKPQTREEFLADWVHFFSCERLDHTFRINVGEPFCNVCGTPNPSIEVTRISAD